jgi:DNA mismatch endonuclease (patch repair protein)
MADVFSKKKRSEIMSRVKGKGNVATEGQLVEIFRRSGIAGWRRNFPLFGRPDFVFPAPKISVFVDGCFWHGCPKHGERPASNRAFWLEKLRRNRARDLRVTKTLRSNGWTVLRIWQHELRHPGRVRRRVLRALRNPV